MERFELARNEEEMKEKYEKMMNYLIEHGVTSDWRIKELLKDLVKDSEFGIENNFPNLSDYDQKRVNRMFDKRDVLIEKYKELVEPLKELLIKEDELWKELQDVNHEICQTQGHRLSENAYEIHDSDGYGRTEHYWVRKCLVCGKEITQNALMYRDCVVKGEEGPKRILYNYKNK